jgi:hypothetical protein
MEIARGCTPLRFTVCRVPLAPFQGAHFAEVCLGIQILSPLRAATYEAAGGG